jgi:hypothetical protein
MNTLKILLIISFLIIIFPSKILLPNGAVLFLSFFQNLKIFSHDKINFESIKYLFFSNLAIVGVFLIILNLRKINILAIIFQYMWLLYMFKMDFFSSIYSVVTLIIYFVISVLLLKKLLFSNS